jgi:hypothetical protein
MSVIALTLCEFGKVLVFTVFVVFVLVGVSLDVVSKSCQHN